MSEKDKTLDKFFVNKQRRGIKSRKSRPSRRQKERFYSDISLCTATTGQTRSRREPVGSTITVERNPLAFQQTLPTSRTSLFALPRPQTPSHLIAQENVKKSSSMLPMGMGVTLGLEQLLAKSETQSYQSSSVASSSIGDCFNPRFNIPSLNHSTATVQRNNLTTPPRGHISDDGTDLSSIQLSQDVLPNNQNIDVGYPLRPTSSSISVRSITVTEDGTTVSAMDDEIEVISHALISEVDSFDTFSLSSRSQSSWSRSSFSKSDNGFSSGISFDTTPTRRRDLFPIQPRSTSRPGSREHKMTMPTMPRLDGGGMLSSTTNMFGEMSMATFHHDKQSDMYMPILEHEEDDVREEMSPERESRSGTTTPRENSSESGGSSSLPKVQIGKINTSMLLSRYNDHPITRPSSFQYTTSVKANALRGLNSNHWKEHDASQFLVRGKNYLKDKMKVASGPNLFRLMMVDLVEVSEPIMDGFCKHPDEPVQVWLAEEKEAERTGRLAELNESNSMPAFLFCINMVLPGPPHYHLVVYFAIDDESLLEPPVGRTVKPYTHLVNKFLFGSDDDFRDRTLKMIPNVAEGNFFLKRAIGTSPVILGRNLTQKIIRTDRYLEAVIDVSSSTMTEKLLKIASAYGGTIVLNIAFVIEGQNESELPEQILGSVQVSNADFDEKIRFVQKA